MEKNTRNKLKRIDNRSLTDLNTFSVKDEVKFVLKNNILKN